MNLRSCYNYSIGRRLANAKYIQWYYAMFTLFYMITSESETLFIILHIVMPL